MEIAILKQCKRKGCEQMEREKVQTGLHIPIERYEELQNLSEQIGISLNALILMLIDLGLSVRRGQINLQQKH